MLPGARGFLENGGALGRAVFASGIPDAAYEYCLALYIRRHIGACIKVAEQLALVEGDNLDVQRAKRDRWIVVPNFADETRLLKCVITCMAERNEHNRCFELAAFLLGAYSRRRPNTCISTERDKWCPFVTEYVAEAAEKSSAALRVIRDAVASETIKVWAPDTPSRKSVAEKTRNSRDDPQALANTPGCCCGNSWARVCLAKRQHPRYKEVLVCVASAFGANGCGLFVAIPADS
jgi:hypothetical protein